MLWKTVDSLRQAGFAGFMSAVELRSSGLVEVPLVPGVYMVTRDPQKPPEFAARSSGGHFKQKDPTVDLATLRSNWVKDALVIYIGKAGGGDSSSTLRRRLKAYLRFGAGQPIGHWGGRFIWQLADADALRFCWRPAGDADALVVEQSLIDEFVRMYGALPFANLRR